MRPERPRRRVQATAPGSSPRPWPGPILLERLRPHVLHGCHVQLPARLRQLGKEPVSGRTKRLRRPLELICPSAGLAALDVFAQAAIGVVAAAASVPDPLRQVGVGGRWRH